MAKEATVKTYKDIIKLINKEKKALFNFKAKKLKYTGRLYNIGKHWVYEIIHDTVIISQTKEKTKAGIKEKAFKEMHFLWFKDKSTIELDSIDKLSLWLDDDIHEELRKPQNLFNASVLGLLS